MPLLKCPDCGKDVSDKAEKCWYCGYPIKDLVKDVEKVKTRKNKRLGWLIFIGIILLAAFINRRTGNDSYTESNSSKSYTTVEDTPSSTSSFCITQQSVGAYSEKDYEQLTKYAVRKESELFSEMILDGRAVILEEGTKVFIEESGFLRTAIRLPDQSDPIWIASEFVSRCK